MKPVKPEEREDKIQEAVAEEEEPKTTQTNQIAKANEAVRQGYNLIQKCIQGVHFFIVHKVLLPIIYNQLFSLSHL
jgi:hypothetical protein